MFTGLYSDKFETAHTKQVKGTYNVSTVQIVLLKITTSARETLSHPITKEDTYSHRSKKENNTSKCR
jgi:hypothetical protein